MPAAALRVARAAACAALAHPQPFAVTLALRGLSAVAVARVILRADGGRIPPRDPATPRTEAFGVVAEDGARWQVAAAPASRLVLLRSPVLAGATGLARLAAVVRALRAQGAQADNHTPLAVHLDVGQVPAPAQALDRLRALAARYFPLLGHGLGAAAPLPVPSAPPASALGRLERLRTRPGAGALAGLDALHPLGAVPSVATLGLDLRAVDRGVVTFALAPVALHSGDVLGHVQIAVGLLHRAATARAVVAAARPVVPETVRYDLRVLLLHLGFIGEAFKVQREQLLRRLPGSAARRRPPRAPELVA